MKSFNGATSSYLLFFLSMISLRHDSVESTLIANYKAIGLNIFLSTRGFFLLWEAVGKAVNLVTKRDKLSPF